MGTWKLKRTKQCEKCPWRVDVDPYDIPDGYSLEQHKALVCTIAQDRFDKTSAMSCHEHWVGEEAMCVGWIVNQTGHGNNIGLRMHMLSCDNAADIKLVGEQHQHFEDTLPGDRL